MWTTGKDSRNAALGAKSTSSGNYANNPKHKLAHLNDGKYGNDYSWISNQRGQGWVQLELPEPAVIDRIEWGATGRERYQDRLPTKYRIEGGLEPGKWFLLTNSADRLPFKTKKTKLLPVTTFPAPSGRSRTGKKKAGSTQKNRGEHRRPLETNQGLRRHLQAADSDPAHASGGPTFPQRKSSPPKDWMY